LYPLKVRIMQEKPSYYAILTADVRYDKNLSPMAKLLYAEITALTQKEGFAWASNQYFAELYGVHKITVSGWVKELRENGYIKVKIVDKTYRKITLSQNTKGVSEKAKGGKRKDLGGVSEKANITLQENNIKNKNGSGFNEPAVQDHRGKTVSLKDEIKKALDNKDFKKLRGLKNAKA